MSGSIQMRRFIKKEGGDPMAGEEIRSRYEQYASLFGRRLHVTVNRPVRAASERRKRPPYPLNGGYVTAADFHAAGLLSQERLASVPDPAAPLHYVYVLGVDHPVPEFTGTVIAVVHRESSAPSPADLPMGKFDRLIVVPDGMELYEPEIRAAVAFAERRFRCRLFCMYEKSCGAVVYTEKDGAYLYLLIRNRSGHIGFPKGHVELGEDECATMKREIFEETALSVEPDLSFREEYHYVLWNAVSKTAVYSVASFPCGQTVTTMANEIFGDWLLPYEEARSLLSYDNDRAILDHANTYLLSQKSSKEKTRL